MNTATGKVLNLWSSFGGTPPVKTDGVSDGPFTVSGSYTDNSTTVVDLTAAARWSNDLEAVKMRGFSGDKPLLYLYCTGWQLDLQVQTAFTGLSIAALRRSLNLHHKPTGQVGTERYWNAYQCAGQPWSILAPEAASTALHVWAKDKGERTMTPSGVLVNLNTDTFELIPAVAVNMGANVVFTLTLYGQLWNTAEGAPPYVDCISAEMAGRLFQAGQNRRRPFSGVVLPGKR